MEKIMNGETTTIKLQKETKERLDNLKEYKRETYEEILQKMLEILNICKFNPARARARLIVIERQKRKTNIGQKPQKQFQRLEKEKTLN